MQRGQTLQFGGNAVLSMAFDGSRDCIIGRLASSSQSVEPHRLSLGPHQWSRIRDYLLPHTAAREGDRGKPSRPGAAVCPRQQSDRTQRGRSKRGVSHSRTTAAAIPHRPLTMLACAPVSGPSSLVSIRSRRSPHARLSEAGPPRPVPCW